MTSINIILIFFRGWEKDPRKSQFEIKGRLPAIRVVAHYKSSVKFFNLPLLGQGVSNSTLSMALICKKAFFLIQQHH